MTTELRNKVHEMLTLLVLCVPLCRVLIKLQLMHQIVVAFLCVKTGMTVFLGRGVSSKDLIVVSLTV